ncbi:hypothetical protein GCM10022254_32440 [Actinomadura meridiana]|uniref:Hsp70 protein n=1 Tax=Actinomadura meridiana TaxID=559626 RepID=A0ABP8C2D0_9ACTN
MAVIHIGIDLGSTKLRAAYAARGAAPKVVSMAGAEWPWLLCEPAAGGTVPVSFPSLKSRLGVTSPITPNGVHVEPTDVVAKALDLVRAEIVRGPGQSVGQTVISVPARFPSTRRAALLAAAARAGLTDVSLITDSAASVISQTAGEGSGTYLVYGMGHSGYELGLVRAERGTYRVLGYDGDAAPSGDTLDTQVLGSWLTALASYGATPREGTNWSWLRRLAEQVKWRLGAAESVLFPNPVPTPGGTGHVEFEQSSFNRQVRALAAGTLAGVATLLTRAELDADAIDLVVLTGGSTGMPAIRDAVEGLGRPTSTAPSDDLARGALRHAQELGHRPPPPYDAHPPESGPRRSEPAARPPPLNATVLKAAQLPDGTREAALDEIRRLINEGRTGVARTELRALITEARSMLDDLDAPRQESTATTPAKDLIAAARKLLDEGNHRNAIALSHRAWQKDRHDVDVFEKMLDLHCTAAMANPRITSFETDEQWLKCALHHDPTSARIRDLLAERNYLQAKDFLRAGKRPEARHFLRATLKWSPNHPDATTALRDLDHGRAP